MAGAFIIQPAFTGGEVSQDIAARVDLDKYQRSLTAAKNTLIKPYGGVYKRPGTLFCGEAKYSDRTAVLARFYFDNFVNYLLEIGDRYIRIWRDGSYLGIELEAPFNLEDLPNLRMTQSADVMYICSRRHPVQVLSRYAEDSWTLGGFETKIPPFEPINPDEENLLTPSATDGDITVGAVKDTFDARQAGSYLKLMYEIPSKTVTLNGVGTSGPVLCGGAWKLISHGTWTGTLKLEKSDDGAAWSDFRTYTLVKREVNGVEVRYVERFAKPSSSSRAIEHVCVDSAVRRKYDVPTDEVEFAGRWGGEFGAAP